MRLQGLLFVALLSASAGAHEFWIAPQTHQAQPNTLLAVHLRVGEDTQGEEVQRSEEHIRRFVALDSSGEKPLVGLDGTTPAGRVRLGGAGVTTLGYHSTPKELVLPAAKFEAYLRDEGLESVLEERQQRGEQAVEGREQFERCAKSLVSVGGASGGGQTLGLPLEFLVLAESADGLQLGLRFEDRPVAGALVRFLRLDAREGSEASAVPTTLRSDSDGRVTAPGAGRWLVSSVHMQRAEESSSADWHSWWASLTYER